MAPVGNIVPDIAPDPAYGRVIHKAGEWSFSDVPVGGEEEAGQNLSAGADDGRHHRCVATVPRERTVAQERVIIIGDVKELLRRLGDEVRPEIILIRRPELSYELPELGDFITAQH